MALEAELIYACTSRGIPWESAREMELWQLASTLGLHRVETRAEYDHREVVASAKAYYEETGEARQAHMAGYAERRRERARQRAEQRRSGSRK